MFIGRENMSMIGKNSIEGSFWISCFVGGLSIAVPGELRAYQKAYQEFGGGVTWSDLFQPTIQLCRNGFAVSVSQASAIKQTEPYILNDPTLRFVFEKNFQSKLFLGFLENFL
jgi:gamma-glutamyltranspeptidase/glutathione hydrolase/leukotriene-C4 hydrolase